MVRRLIKSIAQEFEGIAEGIKESLGLASLFDARANGSLADDSCKDWALYLREGNLPVMVKINDHGEPMALYKPLIHANGSVDWAIDNHLLMGTLQYGDRVENPQVFFQKLQELINYNRISPQKMTAEVA